jgi:hypothetical protein
LWPILNCLQKVSEGPDPKAVLKKWWAMMEHTSIFYVPPEEEIRWCDVRGTRWPSDEVAISMSKSHPRIPG